MATWNDLPPEIIQQILRPLDGNYLVTEIARVSRKLRTLACREYLIQEDIGNSEYIFIMTTTFNPYILPALCAADWIKDVRHLGVFMKLTRSTSIVHNIHILARFIRGLDSLHELSLTIFKAGSLDTVVGMPLKRRDSWWECWRAMLNAALLKGVEELHISERGSEFLPEYIDMKHRPNTQRSWGLKHSIRDRWAKIRSCVRLTRSGSSNLDSKCSKVCLCATCNTNAESRGRIADIELSSMLLSPLFVRDTFGILSANSSTIHTITIGAVNLPLICQNGTWSKSFGQLQFPFLKIFRFDGHGDETSTWMPAILELFSFLNRHPTINTLQLDNVPSGETPKMTFTGDPPYLPKIYYLVARSDVAAYILQRPENCKKLASLVLLSSPNRYHWRPSLPLGVRPALAALASSIPDTSDTLGSISLSLETVDDCLGWANKLEDSGDGRTPSETLKVRGLNISLGFGILLDSDVLLNTIPRWLEKFTSLEWLAISVDQRCKEGFYGSGYEASFGAAVLRSCPHLNSLRIGSTDFCSKDK